MTAVTSSLRAHYRMAPWAGVPILTRRHPRPRPGLWRPRPRCARTQGVDVETLRGSCARNPVMASVAEAPLMASTAMLSCWHVARPAHHPHVNDMFVPTREKLRVGPRARRSTSLGGIHPRRSVALATTLERGCHGWWYDCDMRSAIDSAGRVVIPKPLRARLGLERGRVVEIRERDGRIEIEPASTPMSLARRGGGPVAVPEGKLPPLTDELVRDTIERTRR